MKSNRGPMVSDHAPAGSEFASANANPGKEFGDASPRTMPSAGGSLAMGLSTQQSFDANAPMGEENNDVTGKPDGPMKGPVDNGGASAKLQWG